ncbi:phosphotransferase family protein [Streptomyces cylindrosporus]|uniref:Phosphotransferase family protein n=1 Tax=Streptomyces cylindrosporus TaxID=2927583 RepID=A0ABS9Y8A9_9ACTN|nr:phosphotransferase family protein [Streptomyces cylindrosporus]MCI3273454.1 phosphotransferase family protein [Streptomyces cylindrosporus]
MKSPDLVGIDDIAVERWILALGLEARAPLRFERVGNGRSNLTYLVTDAAGTRWVLRRPPVGPLLPSAHDVKREHRILSALDPTAVPTPGVLAFTDDPDVTDAPLMLMTFVDGMVVDEVSVAQALSPEARARLGLTLARTLARVHEVDLKETGLDTLASHGPYAARQIRRWRRQWEGSRTREVPAVDALADRLEAAVPEQRELTLVHGDYHLLNVIASESGDEIRAVLDWELCTLGDPLADLGALLAYWPRPGDLGEGPFPAPRLQGFPTRAELAGCYAAETGRDISALPFWHALGLWKIAIIGEGVRRRALDTGRGTGHDDPDLLATDLLPGLIRQAELVADEAGL